MSIVGDRPLVSILTPTWQRRDLLLETMANVRAQTYRPLEHVIVSDGPHPGLEWLVKQDASYRAPGDHVAVRYVELGYNTSSYLPDSYCAGPNIVASLVATGGYQSWLADDERMVPQYIETMVAALEATGADFAYPRVAYTRWDTPGYAVGMGCDPPVLGSITTLVYRRELLKRGLYAIGAGRTSDWETIRRWMAAGARHVFVDRVLFLHRDDRDCPPERYADPLPADLVAAVGIT